VAGGGELAHIGAIVDKMRAGRPVVAFHQRRVPSPPAAAMTVRLQATRLTPSRQRAAQR
jgi:hypothetical protein